MRFLLIYIILFFSLGIAQDEHFSVYKKFITKKNKVIKKILDKATIDIESENIVSIEVLMFGLTLNDYDIIIYATDDDKPIAKRIYLDSYDVAHAEYSDIWVNDIGPDFDKFFGDPEEKKYLLNPDDIFGSKNSIQLTYNRTNQIHSKNNADDLPKEVAQKINWDKAKEDKLPKEGKYVKVLFSATDTEYQKVDGTKKRMSQEITELKKQQIQDSLKIKKLQQFYDKAESIAVNKIDKDQEIPEFVDGMPLTKYLTQNSEPQPYMGISDSGLVKRKITLVDETNYPDSELKIYEIWEKGKRLPNKNLHINVYRENAPETESIKVRRFQKNEIESKTLTYIKPNTWSPNNSNMVSFDSEIESKKSINLDNNSTNNVFFDKEISDEDLNVYMTKNELELSSDGSIKIIKRKRNESISEKNQRLVEEKNAKKQKDSIEKISWFSRNVILPVIVAFIGVG